MRIGIDCRLIGTKNAGIGRYIEHLVNGLVELDQQNEYVFISNENNKLTNHRLLEKIENNQKLSQVSVRIPHYSVREQLMMLGLIKSLRVDIIHYPNFNLPILCPTPYIVTIHDLIKHFSRGKETTTRQSWVYWLKYNAGYRVEFYFAVKRAKSIIVPSQTVKEELMKHYSLSPKQVVVTYEGVDQTFARGKSFSRIQTDRLLSKYKINQPYLLYVGNVYPHKNIERLIEAVGLIRKKYNRSLCLVIVCGRSVFWDRLNKNISQKKADDYVNLAGYVPDEDLKVLYHHSSAFVFPTLAEGFGLPGLEAMAAETPVICSNIPVLKEIYQDAVVYFNPYSVGDMAEKINRLIKDKPKQQDLIKRAKRLFPHYRWDKMVKETLAVYNEVGHSLRSNK